MITPLRVCVPFYSAGDAGRRAEACFTVRRRLELEGAEPIAGAIPAGVPLSPGAARTACAARALELGCDPLVFVDGDTVVPVEQLREAAELATAAPGLVYAYQLYLRLDEWATGQLRSHAMLDPIRLPIEQQLFNPPSLGGFAISAACWAELGGFRDGFEGWGYEDCDFATRAARLWPIRRVTGAAWHLWHGARDPLTDAPADSRPERIAANRRLWLDGAAA